MIPPAFATFAARIGFTGAVIAVLGTGLGVSLLNTYADLRLDGPFGIGIGFEGWKPKAERMEGERDAAKAAQEAQEREYRAAGVQAVAIALEAREREDAHHAANKEFADEILPEINRESRNVLDDFISSNGVQDHGIRASAPVAASGDPDNGSPMQADPANIVDAPQLVVVPASDLLICQNYYDRLVVAQNWAAQLNEATP